jgi:hypothetical protein
MSTEINIRVSAVSKAMHGPILDCLRSAINADDIGLLEPILAENALFGSCVGRPQVVQYLRQAVRLSALGSIAVESREDRLIVTSDPREEGSVGIVGHTAVFFVQKDQIVELQLVASHEQAVEAVPTSATQEWSGVRARMTGAATVLPVRDLLHALEHYRLLGFMVREYAGGGYGYAERDGLSLHVNVFAGLDPSTSTSAAYFYVDDADLLYSEWRSSGASGQFFEPMDTDYGLREGAHMDLDGNLLRFGSRARNAE